MVEKYIGKEAADDIFMAALLTGLMTEKQACDILSEVEKDAQWKDIADVAKQFYGGASTVAGNAADTVKTLFGAGSESLKTIGLLAALGGATGVIGSSAYDIIKERMSQEDPETKFNEDIEHLYTDRRRELSDAKWMSRVRKMRDELKRGYKKMTTEEYAEKYRALQEALDERKA